MLTPSVRSCSMLAAALVAAEVDGRTGVVVFRRPVGEAQGVELYVCGEAVPVRTITLPAP